MADENRFNQIYTAILKKSKRSKPWQITFFGDSIEGAREYAESVNQQEFYGKGMILEVAYAGKHIGKFTPLA